MNEKKEKERCPQCDYVLYRKIEGLVCKNWKCKLYFKLGKGWVLLKKTDEQIRNQFMCNLMYAKLAEGKDKLMELKKEVLYEQNYTCQFCKSKIAIKMHHIIPTHVEPIFHLDKDNLILACEECHKKLHANDKHRFG